MRIRTIFSINSFNERYKIWHKMCYFSVYNFDFGDLILELLALYILSQLS